MPSPFVQPAPVTSARDFTQGPFSGITFNGGAVVYNPPPEHLVSGQLRQLQSESNPLVRAARERAMRLANARGSIDGSYSAGAAARATIDAMLPVAQQDSATLTNVQMNNLSNIQNAQQAERDRQELLAANLASGYSAAQDREMARRELDQRLQMQREALAFEGEQAGYGRQHEIGMFDRGFGRDLTLQERDFLGRMGLGEQDIWGRRQIMGDEYGYNMGLAQQQQNFGLENMDRQFGYQSQLSYQDYQQATNQWQQAVYRDITNSLLNNPDLLRNPQAMDGIFQFLLGGEGGTYANSYFSNLFGG